MQSLPEASGPVGLGVVFVLLFIMLGPLKILGPFMHLTHDLDEAKTKSIAVRAFGLAVIAVLVGGFAGRILVETWQISIAALTLAGGIIFLLVGLRLVLEQYQPVHAEPAPLPEEPMAAARRIAFPTVVTPHGIAALIAVLVNSPDAAHTAGILAILIGVMVANLLAMLYARRIMAGVIRLALQIAGAVLGVMQVALAVQIILRGLFDLGVR
jgi:multiple antibiotic resistance protein